MEGSLENSAGSRSSRILPARRGSDLTTTRLAAADLMGRSSRAVLPGLQGTPTEYRVAAEDDRTVLLAKTLTTLGFAEPQDWQGAERSASHYVLATLKRWIADHGGDVIRREFALYATISSTPDTYPGESMRTNLLYLMVNPDSAGYVVMGPALELLNDVNPRLPTAFYRLFVDAVRRWARVYDFEDALDRVEMLREWLEGEPDPEEYELPDVKGCIPKYMNEKPLEVETVRQIAHRATGERISQILTAALDLDRASKKAQPGEIGEETREAFTDSNPPLPALLVSFKHHDAVAGCFVTLSREFGNLGSGV